MHINYFCGLVTNREERFVVTHGFRGLLAHHCGGILAMSVAASPLVRARGCEAIYVVQTVEEREQAGARAGWAVQRAACMTHFH